LVGVQVGASENGGMNMTLGMKECLTNTKGTLLKVKVEIDGDVVNDCCCMIGA